MLLVCDGPVQGAWKAEENQRRKKSYRKTFLSPLQPENLEYPTGF